MKNLLLMIAIILSTLGMAQKSGPNIPNAVTVKGKILFGKEKRTHLIVLCGLDTVIDKKVGKNYRINLPTNHTYDIQFINGDLVKDMIIEEAPDNLYLFKLDIDFICSNEGEIALISYNKSIDDYTFSVMTSLSGKTFN